jgi:RNA polymerase sigma factor (TIGR02999 family)
MSDVTRILQSIEDGDPQAAEELLPLVYDELRKLAAAKMAQEKPGQTLQATALVHDAYLRLVDVDKARHWNSRGHFFAAAAEAMRRILIENARRKSRLKRGGDRPLRNLDDLEIAMADGPADDLILLDDALRKLEAVDATKARIVTLKFFAGMTLPQIAEALGLSSSTVDRYWSYARAWLHREMSRAGRNADR